MHSAIRFTLPVPPSVNNLYANVPGKGRVKTRAYKRWIEDAGWHMKLDGDKVRTWQPIEGPVSVKILGGQTRQDNDAGVKAIFDLMTRMRVWLDDKQVKHHEVYHGGIPRKAVVTITPLVG